jgi:phenylacetate-coenzyme A ligase PaaK-like adenylate-forming protein
MFVVKGLNVYVSTVAEIINRYLDCTTGQFQIFVSKDDPITNCTIRVERRGAAIDSPRYDQMGRELLSILQINPRMEFVEEGQFPKTSEKTKRLLRTL